MQATKMDKLIAEMAVEMYEVVPHDDTAWEYLKQLANRIHEIQETQKKGSP